MNANLNEKTADAGKIQDLLALEHQHKSWRGRLWWLIAAVVVVVAAAAWMLRGGETAAYQFQTKPVTRGNLDVIVTATGNLEPTTKVDVGTEVSGAIASVKVDFNDHVKKGEVLATLDTTRLKAQMLASQAQLESARAKLLQTEATVEQSASELKRLQHVYKLSGGRMPSQSDLDTANATLKRAKADEAAAAATVSQAKASLEVDQTNLDKAVIHSPINGVVLDRKVDPGQTVAASLQAPVLFTLAEDLRSMELQVDVDEADVGRVKEGQSATFTVDAYSDRKFPAKVQQVRFGSQEVDGVITYKTILNVDNSDLSLRPGMTATAEITVQHVDNAVLVPATALRFAPPVTQAATTERSGSLLSRLFPRPSHSKTPRREEPKAGQQKVWVLENGQPKAVRVTIGASDGTNTEITGGDLKPGMEVIVDAVRAKK